MIYGNNKQLSKKIHITKIVLNKIEALLRQKKHKRALDILDGVQSVPYWLRPRFFILTAEALTDLEHYKEAILYYKKTLLRFKTDPVYNNIAYCYAELGKAKMALAYFKKAAAINKSNFVALKSCGDMLLILNQPNAAALFYSKALKINFFYQLAARGLANSYFKSKKYKEAFRVIKQVLEIWPDDNKAQKLMAKLKCLKNGKKGKREAKKGAP
jgi:tetratricopeptide (TPR) repeat protein